MAIEETGLIMFVRYAVLCAACLACGQAQCTGSDRVPLHDNPYFLDPSRACGCYCLKFLDASFGGSADYGQIAELCSPGPQGVTFDRLRDVAETLGYHVRPVKATLNQLCSIRHSAIIHLDKGDGPDHYVVWLGWNGRNAKAYTFSPPGTLDYQDLDTLGSYTGNAMIVSKEPLPEQIWVTPEVGPGQIVLNLAVLAVLLATFVCVYWPRLRFGFSRFLCLPIILSLGAGIPGCGGSHPATTASQVETSRDIDLGEIAETTDLQHTFVVSNVSELPLRILSVEKSCACQAVGVETGLTVDAHHAFSIPYRIPNDGTPGMHYGRLKIVTDSTSESLREIVLSLRAKVKPRIRAIPPQVVFGIVYDGGKRPERQIRLESEVPGLLERFEKAESGRGLVRTGVVATNPGVVVATVVLAEDIPYGELRDTLTFSFRGESDKPVIVEVRAKRVGAVQAIPNSLALESSGIPRQQRLRLKSSSGSLFRITQMDLPSFCSAEVSSNELSAVHEVTLQCSPAQCDKGESKCLFHTDISETPLIVPLRVN